MTKPKFWKQDSINPNIKKIQALRQEVTSLLANNNPITEKIWEIDIELTSASDAAKEKLLDEKKKLLEKLAAENYAERINALKKEIYDLEIKEWGKSDILDDSPAPNNNLL